MNLPFLPLAGQSERKVEELCRPCRGTRDKNFSIIRDTYRGEGEVVEINLLNYPGLRYLFDSSVRPHHEDGGAVRGECQVGEGYAFHHDLLSPVASGDVPLVHRSVVSTGDKFEIVN